MLVPFADVGEQPSLPQDRRAHVLTLIGAYKLPGGGGARVGWGSMLWSCFVTVIPSMTNQVGLGDPKTEGHPIRRRSCERIRVRVALDPLRRARPGVAGEGALGKR